MEPVLAQGLGCAMVVGLKIEGFPMLGMIIALAAAAQGTAAPQAPDADPVVCQRQQSEVGTHMRPKKVCMRKSEWDYVERHTRDKLQSLNQKGTNPGQALGHGSKPQ
jgi:hypothetical protein